MSKRKQSGDQPDDDPPKKYMTFDELKTEYKRNNGIPIADLLRLDFTEKESKAAYDRYLEMEMKIREFQHEMQEIHVTRQFYWYKYICNYPMIQEMKVKVAKEKQTKEKQ